MEGLESRVEKRIRVKFGNRIIVARVCGRHPPDWNDPHTIPTVRVPWDFRCLILESPTRIERASAEIPHAAGFSSETIDELPVRCL
jgi:hypothetical protein